jgi:hypothetical protein
MAENSLYNILLTSLDKTDDLHGAAALRTSQRIDFIHPLDQHGPGGD